TSDNNNLLELSTIKYVRGTDINLYATNLMRLIEIGPASKFSAQDKSVMLASAFYNGLPKSMQISLHGQHENITQFNDIVAAAKAYLLKEQVLNANQQPFSGRNDNFRSRFGRNNRLSQGHFQQNRNQNAAIPFSRGGGMPNTPAPRKF